MLCHPLSICFIIKTYTFNSCCEYFFMEVSCLTVKFFVLAFIETTIKWCVFLSSILYLDCRIRMIFFFTLKTLSFKEMHHRNLFIEIRNHQAHILVVQGCLVSHDMLYVSGLEDRNVLSENKTRRLCH